ncbi:MAG: signal transduction response regulator [Paenibacillaceae bacterium]|jgi:YesN/AraC family two-component response regulator|nr:signal transduction response regulator [Paenibacillaceae bacterium]
MSGLIDILLVEDEAEVLEGMRCAIAQAPLPWGHIYAVGNAEDAEDIMMSRRPHIIVTDIVLPRRSGLELLETAAGLGQYEPKMIVVSSYNEFDYARRSLQLGALDYVLKPFHIGDFIGKLKDIVRMIQEEARSETEHQLHVEHARIGNKLLMDQHILGYCTKKTVLQEHIYHKLQLWGLTWLTTSAYHVIAFCAAGDMPDHDTEVELQLFSVGNIAEETLREQEQAYLVRNVHNRWIIITGARDTEALIAQVRDNVKRYQKLDLQFGISCAMHAFQSLAEAYDQALTALRWAAVNDQTTADYRELQVPADGAVSGDLNEYCVMALIHAEVDELRSAVNAKVEQLVRSNALHHRRQLGQACLDWIVEIQSVVHERTGIATDQIPLSLWERLDRYDTVESVKRELHAYFLELSRSLSPQITRMGNAWIEQAKKVIEELAGENATLQGVAARLSIHPVWLSQLFKKETGQTFSDYMIDWRITRAKALLRESGCKIYEIAAMVGYQDLQYFGKLFKKRTGMSPKEYRYGK